MEGPTEQPGSGSPRQPLERIGVAGIWCRNGQILMTRRAAGIPYGNLWCFPGGGIDPGENEIQALQREWREELGTDVRPIRKLGSSEVSHGRFLLHWYLVEGEDKPLQPNPAEVAEVRWIDLQTLLTMPDLLESNRQLLQTLGHELTDASCGLWHSLQEHLEHLRQSDMHRTLRTVSSPSGRLIGLASGREAINFASNDYLGLAADPRIIQAIHDALGRWGWGAGASQLISGHTTLHADLETAIARFKGTEAAIVLPTGYMANLAVIRTLAAPEDVILLDKLNHASIIDAATACGAKMRVFPHRNYSKLADLLQRCASARRRLIVTDTVFSMDGDLADLPELVRLKRQYGAILIVDEAHATGVLGPAGRGAAELQGVEPDIDVAVGTLSKALGGIGGFVAGRRLLIDALVNLARPFIFTTGLPAAACAAAMRALDLVGQEPWRRRQALTLADRLRTQLRQSGWDCADSQTQIVPVIVGAAGRAVELSRQLLDQGFFVPAIRPPAVPPNGSRLRISVTASHTEQDIDALASALGGR